jgi:hypothetical protein
MRATNLQAMPGMRNNGSLGHWKKDPFIENNRSSCTFPGHFQLNNVMYIEYAKKKNKNKLEYQAKLKNYWNRSYTLKRKK